MARENQGRHFNQSPHILYDILERDVVLGILVNEMHLNTYVGGFLDDSELLGKGEVRVAQDVR